MYCKIFHYSILMQIVLICSQLNLLEVLTDHETLYILFIKATFEENENLFAVMKTDLESSGVPKKGLGFHL